LQKLSGSRSHSTVGRHRSSVIILMVKLHNLIE
jgi:hypothetical protein